MVRMRRDRVREGRKISLLYHIITLLYHTTYLLYLKISLLYHTIYLLYLKISLLDHTIYLLYLKISQLDHKIILTDYTQTLWTTLDVYIECESVVINHLVLV